MLFCLQDDGSIIILLANFVKSFFLMLSSSQPSLLAIMSNIIYIDYNYTKAKK